ITGSIESARKYGLPHEILDRPTLSSRFPQFHVPADTVAFFENRAGFLVPEKVVASQALLAMRHGAELHGQERVTAWLADAGGVRVDPDRDSYPADRVIFCGGAWSSRLLTDLGVELKVTRQVMAWFWPKHPETFALGTFPSWALDLEERSRF